MVNNDLSRIFVGGIMSTLMSKQLWQETGVMPKIGVLDYAGALGDDNNIIVDDMIDTAGTITKAADLMMEKGASSVRCMVSHALLSGSACERIEKSSLKEVIVTDSIPIKQDCKKIKIISVAEMFADVIHKAYNNESISSSFLF